MMPKNHVLWDEQVTCHADFKAQVVNCHDKLLAVRNNVDEFYVKICEFITVGKEIPLKKIEKVSELETINEIGQNHQVSSNRLLNVTVL